MGGGFVCGFLFVVLFVWFFVVLFGFFGLFFFVVVGFLVGWLVGFVGFFSKRLEWIQTRIFTYEHFKDTGHSEMKKPVTIKTTKGLTLADILWCHNKYRV